MRQKRRARSPQQPSRRLGLRYLLAGAGLVFASCAHNKVESFSVEPPLVCPGQVVSVRWHVQGRASLRAERAPDDWDEEPALSQGERRLALEKSTTFTLRALDANQAEGQSYGTKTADLAQGPTTKAAAATCDAVARKCRGSFALATSGGPVVRTIGSPHIVWAGRVQPGRICVSHEGMATACVSAGEKVDVAVKADGAWTLETDLPAGESGTPGPQLRVELGFGCP